MIGAPTFYGNPSKTFHLKQQCGPHRWQIKRSQKSFLGGIDVCTRLCANPFGRCWCILLDKWNSGRKTADMCTKCHGNPASSCKHVTKDGATVVALEKELGGSDHHSNHSSSGHHCVCAKCHGSISTSCQDSFVCTKVSGGPNNWPTKQHWHP